MMLSLAFRIQPILLSKRLNAELCDCARGGIGHLVRTGRREKDPPYFASVVHKLFDMVY